MSSSKRSSFLDLPAELRLKIYALVLPHGIDVHVSTQMDIYNRTFQSLFEPAICATNRQIRQETLPLLYGNNKFTCRDEGSTIRLLTKLRPERVAMLKSIRLLGNFEISITEKHPSKVVLEWRNHQTVSRLNLVEERYGTSLSETAVWLQVHRPPQWREQDACWERLVDIEILEVVPRRTGWAVKVRDGISLYEWQKRL